MTRSTVTRSTAKRSTAKIGPSIERKELPRCLNPCTLCVIRKRRCDAQTPCENCTKRGAANQCRRRPRRSLGTASPGRTLTSPNQNQPSSQSSSTQSSLSSVRSESPTPEVFAKQALPSRPRSSGGVEDVQQDVAVTLDFPPLSRRQLVQAPQKYEEMFFTAKQINDLLIFHGGCLAWIHNVVHLPSFRDQCQSKLAGDELPTDKTWDALYYSMLAFTLHHMQPARLEEMGLVLFDHCVEFFYEKTIECLNDAKFMENHNIFTVQAICLLTYIGHHIGQSNRMSVLVAAAIRIAQCLGLHRLGPDKKLADPALNRQKLHRREVSKRVWWFLVRQDWLQIPVSNTCNIHPRQFDTPMPDGNCLIADGQAIDRNMIQGGYTSVLNKAAFIVWRFHDSVTSNEESSRKVYSEVLKADNQLRKLMNDIPFYLRQESPEDGMKHQSALLYLELAQQFYSIHRFFQISSLKDPNFAYTKISCSPFMYRNLFTFLSLEKNNPSTQIVSYLWTSNTHVLTAALWLLFEMIFSKEGMAQIYEAAEIRELAAKTFEFLRANERESKVAKRGVILIETLLEIDQAVLAEGPNKFSLRDILSRVIDLNPRVSEVFQTVSTQPFNLNAPLLDLVYRDDVSLKEVLSAFIDS